MPIGMNQSNGVILNKYKLDRTIPDDIPVVAPIVAAECVRPLGI